MKSILDPAFRYTPSIATDVRKTFERIRREAMPRMQLRPGAPRLLAPALRETPAQAA
jgi:hypothetical protein